MLDRASENALAEAIEEIRSGRSSIAEILLRPEAQDTEFVSLLRLATSIQIVDDLEPSMTTRAALRSRVMSEIASQTERERLKKPASLWQLWRRMLAVNRLASIGVTLLLVLALTAGGTVQASQDSLPGDALYGIKLASEQVQISVAQSPEARIEALLQIAQRRTQEMSKASDMNPLDVELLAMRYEANIAETLQTLATVGQNDGNKERVIERVLTNLERHQAHLQEVYENVPDPAKDAILHARNTSRHGLETAIGAKSLHQDEGFELEIKFNDKAQQMKDPTATPSNRNPGRKNPGQSSHQGEPQTTLMETGPNGIPFSELTPRPPVSLASQSSSNKSTVTSPSITPDPTVTLASNGVGTRTFESGDARDKKSTPGSKPADAQNNLGQQHAPGLGPKAQDSESKADSASDEKASGRQQPMTTQKELGANSTAGQQGSAPSPHRSGKVRGPKHSPMPSL